MKIKVAELRPNPFRDFLKLPTNPRKVEALRESIGTTGFWDNLVARKAPDGNGYELSYGHNRLDALIAEKIDEIDIPVRKLSDTIMMQIMSRENMEEYGHNALVDQETVRAAVLAYAAGKIALPKPNGRTSYNQLFYAPSFTPGNDPGYTSNSHPYTTETLGQFLGWTQKSDPEKASYKVRSALSALAMMEASLAEPATFAGLTNRQALIVVDAANHAQKILEKRKDPQVRTRVKAVARAIANGLQITSDGVAADGTTRAMQGVTIHNYRRATDAMIGEKPAKAARTLPEISRFVEAMTKRLHGVAMEEQAEKLDAIVKYRDDLDRDRRNALVRALRQAAHRLTKYADKIAIPKE
jgi:hypothetical protein